VHWTQKGALLMARFVYDQVKDVDGWKPTHSLSTLKLLDPDDAG
jgi:hypothetical protein